MQHSGRKMRDEMQVKPSWTISGRVENNARRVSDRMTDRCDMSVFGDIVSSQVRIWDFVAWRTITRVNYHGNAALILRRTIIINFTANDKQIL